MLGTYLFRFPLTHRRHFQTREPQNIYSILIKKQEVHSTSLSENFCVCQAVSMMMQMQASLAFWASTMILEKGLHHTPSISILYCFSDWSNVLQQNKLCERTVCLCLCPAMAGAHSLKTSLPILTHIHTHARTMFI